MNMNSALTYADSLKTVGSTPSEMAETSWKSGSLSSSKILQAFAWCPNSLPMYGEAAAARD